MNGMGQQEHEGHEAQKDRQQCQGLYDARFEHDACGIGAVVNIHGVKSHDVVDNALKIVERLSHRAGRDADGDTGDGVGILLQIPHDLFRAEKLGFELPEARDYGVGMIFLPTDAVKRGQLMRLMEIIVEKEGMKFLGWRKAPIREELPGRRARSRMPSIWQCFVKRPAKVARGLDFDRRLYVARRVFEQSSSGAYFCSFSSRTIVYKGMMLVDQLRTFYKDLESELCRSALATVHSRFSTNTNPSWERAHPNRLILHNGEINTIRGNVDRMVAREETVDSPLLEADRDKIMPIVDQSGSDSAMLDNTLEFLMMYGMELPKAVMVTVPEPWQNNQEMSRDRRDLYRYYATMMEPWDGPAALIFSDGDIVGASLDRNGLRPSRYLLTDDDTLILASEVGVLDIDPAKVLRKERLKPGALLVVDTVAGEVYEDAELKETYARRQPYGEWLYQHLLEMKDLPLPNERVPTSQKNERAQLYRFFDYTWEDMREVILPMALGGSEPTASMGTDTPLAVLSSAHPLLFGYFKQLFAQVTNPPIDAIRESLVTDTAVYVGADGNLLMEKPENCAVLKIDNPIITAAELMRIRGIKKPHLSVETISMLCYKNTPMGRAVDQMLLACDRAVARGANVLILSDRGVDENRVAIPSLLATSAIEQHLVRTKKRTQVSMILETAEPRSVHHFVLLGYGARAVCPYLAHECIKEMIDEGLMDKDLSAATQDYNKAVTSGIVKIASKMGISTIQSYQSAQIFEAVGLARDMIEQHFTNTVSRVGGVGLSEITEDVEYRHNRAFDPMGLPMDTTPESTGDHRLRSGDRKEDHLYDPETICALQKAVRAGSYELFKEYSRMVDDEGRPHTLRGLTEFVFDPNGGVPIEEVEPVSEIVKRFKTGAMSYGSISQEAHECLATAMNRLGGRSNSGEGGEDVERFGTERVSRIKQVASGRFGVTSGYLMSADEIQIKMAQGAKPGEGGHLPGKKVYPWIAKTRHSTPGVSLISPPPHHDIYSIEDLAQLIYDLKNANRRARISVKLVSEAGVGTIASGVAKAGAQVILISGYDGGTGAAPRTSIHDAGLPWELGVAETHQTLMRNGLRSHVRIETDGKLMSGRDVAIACILGAEEFGFATAPLVTVGCVMMRVCNLDTCPMGVATQNPELRKRFSGKPEYVENFMRFVAQELRELMAKMGVKTVDEMVGRTDLIRMRSKRPAGRAMKVDLSAILTNPYEGPTHFDPKDTFDFALSESLDEKALLEKLGAALQKGKKSVMELTVSSTNRALGTIFGSEITRIHGNNLPDDTYTIRCTGGGGQSFGAFAPRGLTLVLEGDSNDSFGKGLSGGRLAVFPPKASKFVAAENIIVGNVALYGATSGEVFIAGVAGERFCVRNSGATAVVEGVGDHGCEYMTGGTAVVLGETGRNFAAGMCGGIAYVLDEKHTLYRRLNRAMVLMESVAEAEDVKTLRGLIEKHVEMTGSVRGKEVLKHFEELLPSFKKIIPAEYKRVLERR
jgi:glutamate synthase (ferredoxin)